MTQKPLVDDYYSQIGGSSADAGDAPEKKKLKLKVVKKKDTPSDQVQATESHGTPNEPAVAVTQHEEAPVARPPVVAQERYVPHSERVGEREKSEPVSFQNKKKGPTISFEAPKPIPVRENLATRMAEQRRSPAPALSGGSSRPAPSHRPGTPNQGSRPTGPGQGNRPNGPASGNRPAGPGQGNRPGAPAQHAGSSGDHRKPAAGGPMQDMNALKERFGDKKRKGGAHPADTSAKKNFK